MTESINRIATPPAAQTQTLPARRFFTRLIYIYILDWVVILGTISFAASTGAWAKPNARPFINKDPQISFPFQTRPKISPELLIVLSAVVPTLAIFLCAVALPSRSLSYVDSSRTSQGWKRRLCRLNSAWLGLGLAIAIAMLVTDGLKNLVGRPRPDMLSRCEVDDHLIDKDGIGPGGLLTWDVCRSLKVPKGTAHQMTVSELRDGFRSFPSGHSSMSFAGLTYLAIFLAEFVFALPLASVATRPTSTPIARRAAARATDGQENAPEDEGINTTSGDHETSMPRFPIMAMILICGIPVLIATYVASTRFSDFRHHPFDILFGSSLGIFAAIGGWRWYGAWCCAGGEGGVYGLVGAACGADLQKPLYKRVDDEEALKTAR